MHRSLGGGGYASAIHHLLTKMLTSDMVMLPPHLHQALDSARGTLAVIAGTMDEEDARDCIEEARCLLLAAEMLVDRADALAAPTTNCDGELSSRLDWYDLHEILDEAQEQMEGEE